MDSFERTATRGNPKTKIMFWHTLAAFNLFCFSVGKTSALEQILPRTKMFVSWHSLKSVVSRDKRILFRSDVLPTASSSGKVVSEQLSLPEQGQTTSDQQQRFGEKKKVLPQRKTCLFVNQHFLTRKWFSRVTPKKLLTWDKNGVARASLLETSFSSEYNRLFECDLGVIIFENVSQRVCMR